VRAYHVEKRTSLTLEENGMGRVVGGVENAVSLQLRLSLSATPVAMR